MGLDGFRRYFPHIIKHRSLRVTLLDDGITPDVIKDHSKKEMLCTWLLAVLSGFETLVARIWVVKPFPGSEDRSQGSVRTLSWSSDCQAMRKTALGLGLGLGFRVLRHLFEPLGSCSHHRIPCGHRARSRRLRGRLRAFCRWNSWRGRVMWI